MKSSIRYTIKCFSNRRKCGLGISHNTPYATVTCAFVLLVVVYKIDESLIKRGQYEK